MPRVTEDDFADKEIACIYIAESISEATTIEQILNENDVNYLIDIEQYTRPSLLTNPIQTGVVFYVLAGQIDFCRNIIQSKGMSRGITHE